MFEFFAQEIHAGNGVLPVAVGHATAADHGVGRHLALDFAVNADTLLQNLQNLKPGFPATVLKGVQTTVDLGYKLMISPDDGPVPPPPR
jgi:hypothetical protein